MPSRSAATSAASQLLKGTIAWSPSEARARRTSTITTVLVLTAPPAVGKSARTGPRA